jgi:hypothetical protein
VAAGDNPWFGQTESSALRAVGQPSPLRMRQGSHRIAKSELAWLPFAQAVAR